MKLCDMKLCVLPNKLCQAIGYGEILSIDVKGIDAALPLFYEKGEVVITATELVTDIICKELFSHPHEMVVFPSTYDGDVATLKRFIPKMFDLSKLYLTMNTMGTKDGLNIYDMLSMAKTKAFQVELEELEFRGEFFVDSCSRHLRKTPAQNMARHIKSKIKNYINGLLQEIDLRLRPTYECSGRFDQVLFFFELMHCLDINARAEDPDWKFTTKGD